MNSYQIQQQGYQSHATMIPPWDRVMLFLSWGEYCAKFPFSLTPHHTEEQIATQQIDTWLLENRRRVSPWPFIPEQGVT